MLVSAYNLDIIPQFFELENINFFRMLKPKIVQGS